jgi:hypothetical protein
VASEGLEEMFEGNFADMCGTNFGRTESLVCADPRAIIFQNTALQYINNCDKKSVNNKNIVFLCQAYLNKDDLRIFSGWFKDQSVETKKV